MHSILFKLYLKHSIQYLKYMWRCVIFKITRFNRFYSEFRLSLWCLFKYYFFTIKTNLSTVSSLVSVLILKYHMFCIKITLKLLEHSQIPNVFIIIQSIRIFDRVRELKFSIYINNNIYVFIFFVKSTQETSYLFKNISIDKLCLSHTIILASRQHSYSYS